MPPDVTIEKNMDIAYFPSLPVVRARGIYVIDKKQQTDMCRKSNCRHSTLLPVIFTIFCPHGNFF